MIEQNQQKTLYTSIIDRIREEFEKSVETEINTLQESDFKNKTHILQVYLKNIYIRYIFKNKKNIYFKMQEINDKLIYYTNFI